MNTISSKFSNLIIIAGIALVSGLVFSLLAMAIISLIYPINIAEIGEVLQNLNDPQAIEKAKILLLFNSIGLFVVPPLLFAFLTRKRISRFFKFRNSPTLALLPLLLLLFFISLPIINLSAELNSYLQLPDEFSKFENWMKSAENSAMVMTKALLQMNNPTDLLVNIFLIGVVPALGEELMFRGVIQQVLTRNSKNYHFGIWISAIIFSAIHLQFYGFLPRLLLGAYFGYLFYWSKNIWFPIVAHFLNNSIAVIAAYYLGSNGLEEKLEKVGTTNDTLYFSIFSAIVFVWIFNFLRKRLFTLRVTSYST